MHFLACMAAVVSLVLTTIQPATAQETAATVAGDAHRGAALFSGAQAFAKGAAPCAACHSLHDKGINGARMASDLSGLFTADGADSVKDVIGGIDVPVMKKMYASKPLTDAELADLAAFARQPSADKQPATGFPLPLAGAGAAFLFLIVFALYKRRIS